MIQLTLSKVLFSVLCATCFGFFLAVLGIAGKVVVSEIKILPAVIKSVFVYDEKPWRIERGTFRGVPLGTKSRIAQEIFQFIKIIAFSLLFILLSYFALDGQIRIYMLAIALLSLFFTRKMLSKTIFPVLCVIIGEFYRFSAIALRLAFYIPRKFCLQIKKIF